VEKIIDANHDESAIVRNRYLFFFKRAFEILNEKIPVGVPCSFEKIEIKMEPESAIIFRVCLPDASLQHLPESIFKDDKENYESKEEEVMEIFNRDNKSAVWLRGGQKKRKLNDGNDLTV